MDFRKRLFDFAIIKIYILIFLLVKLILTCILMEIKLYIFIYIYNFYYILLLLKNYFNYNILMRIKYI